MLRKNTSKRFHTAAARIVMTGKLPEDFFLPPHDNLRRGRTKWSNPHRSEASQFALKGAHPDMLFTFHRANTSQKPRPEFEEPESRLKQSDSFPKMLKLPQMPRLS